MKNAKLYAIYIIIVIISASLYFSIHYNKQNENKATVTIRTHENTAENEEKDEEPKEKVTEKTTKKSQQTKEIPDNTEENLEENTEILWININTADIAELEKLKGIGTATAQEIIRYREENGDFANIDELINVKGIGEIKLNDIRECIYVDNPYIRETEQEIVTEQIEQEEEPATEEEITEHIPTLEEIAPIDINTAEKEELMLLPNVDEQTAESIIELRERIGAFSNPLELIYIDELTQKEVSELLEFVMVGNMQ